MNSSILAGKDPSDIKDYGIDWTYVLTAEGESGFAASYWGSASGNDLASDGAGVVASATYTFVAGDIGRTLQIIDAGSGFTPGAYVIASVLDGKATLETAPGALQTDGVWHLLGRSAPEGLTYTTSVVGLTTLVWVRSGVSGTTYAISNSIVTAGVTPRTHQRTIIIPCVQR